MTYIYEEVHIESTMDKTLQPSLFFKAKGEKRPLLVGLHTWSHDRYNQIKNMLPYAQKYDFHLLLPDFRGANLVKNIRAKEACASELAKQDILDAIAYVKENYSIDESNIFLIGASGGGHMALMMAAVQPLLFKAIAAFVPITDLSKWVYENKNYREHVLYCCGNDEYEMRRRSPIYFVDEIAKANLKIFHGKFDPVVPVTHSINLYNSIISKFPNSRTFFEIFDGGHQMDMEAAMRWINSQHINNLVLENVTG